MCFKLLFLIAFQIMRCACRNISVSLLFPCSSGHFCYSEEKQIQKKDNVDDLMPVPILHFFLFFHDHHFLPHVVFFSNFLPLTSLKDISLFFDLYKWWPVVTELMRFGVEVEKVNFKVWGWHFSVLYVSYYQQITWKPKQNNSTLFRYLPKMKIFKQITQTINSAFLLDHVQLSTC